MANQLSSPLYALQAPLADPGHYFQRMVGIWASVACGGAALGPLVSGLRLELSLFGIPR